MDDHVYLLIKQSKKGHVESLVSLINEFKDDYYRLAFTYTGNKEDAMDAVEDMTLIIYQKMKSLKKEDAFLSWSRTILVNACKKIVRKRKKTLSLSSIKEEGYEENFTARDHNIDFQHAFKVLSEEQVEAIKLRYFLDYDIKTIARILEVPEGTVKSRISIGLQKLKERLGDEPNERSI